MTTTAAIHAGTGLGVDSGGGPVIDPTANVIDLVEAAVKRLDDLRVSEGHMAVTLVTHIAEMAELRAQHAKEMRDSDEKLRLAESARIDAIRSVDVGAVNRAAEVSATAAAALAAQLVATADASRSSTAAAASASVTSLAAALEPIQKDIQDLRRAQYEQQGQKDQKTDTRLSTGQIVAIVGVLIAMTSVLIGATGIAVALYLALHHTG